MASRVPTLIGISGGRGSGKDTAYGFIAEWATSQGLTPARRAFADPLKHSFTRIFFPDATLEEALIWCDKIKNNGLINAGDGAAVTGRQALQHYGYEAHRELFGDNFWIDQLLPEKNWRMKFSDDGVMPDVCVITDVRYDNEAQRILDAGGTLWKIERDTGSFDEHTSEAGINNSLIDYTIINTDLAGYKTQVVNLAELVTTGKNKINA